MATQEKTWNVANRLHSLKDSDNPEVNHIIAGSDEIYDDEKGAKQSDINAQTDSALADRYTKAETYSKEQLDALITTPDVNYVTMATFADLPQTGEANTIYRVSSYDGTQVDASKYALYAWNGTSYQLLAVRSAVGEVFDVSEYNSGATYETLAAALAAVPSSVQRGGLSIKFILRTNTGTEEEPVYVDEYVQYRLMKTAWSTVVADWQGVDSEPTAGSRNLVESGAVASVVNRNTSDINDIERLIAFITQIQEDGLFLIDDNGNVGMKVLNGVLDVLDLGNNVKSKIVELINSTVDLSDIDNSILALTESLSDLEDIWTSNYSVVTTDNGFYLVDSNGNIGLSFVDGILDVVGLSERLKGEGNNNEADLNESITINKMYEELKELKDKTDASVMSLQSMKKSGTYFSGSITIPSSNVDREHVIVRVGVHKGSNLTGRTTPYNEVFFGGDCENDFSDIRFLDNGKMLNTRKLHSGNYEIYRDKNFSPGTKIVNDSNGYIYTIKSNELYRSSDGGATFTKIANSVNIVNQIIGIDSRDYLYLNVKDTDSSHVSYNSTPYIYMLDLGNSFDQDDFILICDMTYAGWQTTPELFDSVRVNAFCELDGYVFFGRYQAAHNPIIYRSINNTVTPVSGEYTKVVYDQVDVPAEKRDQHIHNLYAVPSLHQVFANIDNAKGIGPTNLYSIDYGEAWTDWTDSIDSEEWKQQRGHDYLPAFVSSDGTWMLGSGEVNILGGCTMCKVNNTITNGVAVPTSIERMVETAQGCRAGSAYSDNFIILGLNSGSGGYACAHILMVTENGKKYETIYSQLDTAPNNAAGNGPRYFTQPFVPNGESDKVIYINGINSNSIIDPLRFVKGGTHYYGEILVDVGSISANETKTITVESGYAMAQPNVQVLTRDFVKPIYQVPLNEGNGCIIKDSNGVKHTIVGRYSWDSYDNGPRFSGMWPAEKPYDSRSGLRLYDGAYIDLGKVPQLDFNKGFAISFWMKYDDVSERDIRTLRYSTNRVILSNEELYLSLVKYSSIRYGSTTSNTMMDLAWGIYWWHVWRPFVINITNDSLPSIHTCLGEAGLKDEATVIPSAWAFSNLSELPLRIGCQNYVAGSEDSFPFYISDVRIYDHPLSWQEIVNIYNGRYREPNI